MFLVSMVLKQEVYVDRHDRTLRAALASSMGSCSKSERPLRCLSTAYCLLAWRIRGRMGPRMAQRTERCTHDPSKETEKGHQSQPVFGAHLPSCNPYRTQSQVGDDNADRCEYYEEEEDGSLYRVIKHVERHIQSFYRRTAPVRKIGRHLPNLTLVVCVCMYIYVRAYVYKETCLFFFCSFGPPLFKCSQFGGHILMLTVLVSRTVFFPAELHWTDPTRPSNSGEASDRR